MGSENEWVDLIKKGDHSAFEQMVGKYKNRVFNTIYSVMGDSQEADDIAQEVFVKVYFSINSFKGKSSFATWLYRITVNECIDALKKRKNKTVSIESSFSKDDKGAIKDILQGNEDSIEKQMISKETQKIITNLIFSLPEKYSLIVILKDIENLSYKEISQAMNISMDKVKVYLFRARQSLKQKLESCGEANLNGL
ncbi:MAG: sigma-70 family RNA polymerase sigma factor [Elusimicrobia bacterium]|nr:sigma-70 family RNA polymerase sigma factor [Elusimicrobiota bacterium]